MSPGIDAQAARLGELLRPIQDEKAAMEYVFNFVVKYNRDYRIVEENTNSIIYCINGLNYRCKFLLDNHTFRIKIEVEQVSREIFFHTAHYYNQRQRKTIHLQQLLGFMKTNIDRVLHALHETFHQQHERTALAAPGMINPLNDHSQNLENKNEGLQQTTNSDEIEQLYDYYLGVPQSNTQSQ